MRLTETPPSGAEIEALLLIANAPWDVSTESKEGRIADMVLRTLCARGMARLERPTSTCHRFVITEVGRAVLTQE